MIIIFGNSSGELLNLLSEMVARLKSVELFIVGHECSFFSPDIAWAGRRARYHTTLNGSKVLPGCIDLEQLGS